MLLLKRFPAPVRVTLLLSLILTAIVSAAVAQDNGGEISCAFTNPIKDAGQDPSVVFRDGFYYLVQSEGGSLVMRKSARLTDLGSVDPVTVYTPPTGTPYSQELWAPELVYVRGGWYIYLAADDGANANHRMYVLEADSDDPLGVWTFKGVLETDKWAIDGAVFEYRGQLYMVWSGWPGDTGDFPQNLYLAPMSDPLTVSERHLISEPDQPWERSVQPINEGPEPFIHGDTLSIVYSADASWSAAYKLGLLTLTGSDPLDRASWTKTGPVLEQVEGAYGPGHNSMPVKSPDGTEDWFLYHAKSLATDGWEDRQIHAKPFTWDADGRPVFDPPATSALPLPSGEPCGEVARYTLDGNLESRTEGAPSGKVSGTASWVEGRYGQALALDGAESYVDLTAPLLNTTGSFSVAAWVSLDATDRTMTFVSQDGGISSNFALQYSVEAGNRLAFTTFAPMGQVDAQAVSSFAPEPNRWYQMIGVRDALQGQIRLYVDGKLEATALTHATWATRGSAILGAARVKLKRAQYLSGKLDDVIFFNGALSDAKAASLFTR